MRGLLTFIRRGMEVKRFHTMKTLCEESVGEHSAGVALFCLLLEGEQAGRNLLIAALVHDLAEQVFGDIPAPTKRALSIGKEVGMLEEEMLKHVGLDILLTPAEKRTLKIADILDGMCFCLREKSFGNKNMDPVYGRYKEYLKNLEPFLNQESMVIGTVNSLWKEADNVAK